MLTNQIDVYQLADKGYRLDNLYRIIDRHGRDIPFRLNAVQKDVLKNIHNRNLILKARQLGMSTFAVIDLLDDAIWTPNLSSGIVSYSLEHAQHIFKRIIGHALDNLPNWLKVDIINRSAREITFANGSMLRVDTTLRGGAYQLVLVSEFGKTCARSPQKAEEIVTGTLQAVPAEGRIIIESTGEGNDGFFAEMVNLAAQRGNDNLSPLDYRLFFYPWYSEPSYILKKKVSYDVDLTDYFNKLEAETNTKISQDQRNWYAQQKGLLGDKVKQEFPSTVSEAFLSSSDAYYFAEGIERAYQSNRCLYSPLYDPLSSVYVAMDIGVNDLTVMTFFQVIHGEIRIIDYYEDKNKGVDFYAKLLLQDKNYLYHTIFLPHDAVKRDGIIVENSYEREFKKLFAHTGTKFIVLKKTDKQIQISNAKIKLDRCVFNLTKVKPLLTQLSKYRKKWSEQYGKYLDEPYHGVECFIGETLINTEDGLKRIDEIDIGENVKTPSGFKKVLKKVKYQTNNLIKIKTNNKYLICTAYHKVFTEKGLVCADTLCYNDGIFSLGDSKICNQISSLGKEKGLGFKDYFLSMNQNQLYILMDMFIEKTNMGIGWGVINKLRHYIEQYGYIIMGKSLRKCMSIIKMKINQIMKLKTYNSLNQVLTLCYTLPKIKEKDQNYFSIKQEYLHKNGTHQMRVENGIENTEKKHLNKKNKSIKFALFAKKIINLFGLNQSFAQMHVEQKIEGNQVLMMRKESVKSVEKNIVATNMLLKERVQEVVPLFLEKKEFVYDLKIEDDHCYFANDLLVSNSNYADSFIYAMQAVTHIETVSNMGGAFEKHKKAVENRRHMI